MVVNVMDAVAKNFRTAVNKNFSKDDCVAVWDAISEQVVEELCRGHALCIQEFGTFTLSEWKIHSGGKTCFQNIQPVFILSNKLATFYNVRTIKCFTTYKIPTKKLNFSLIAYKCHRRRGDINIIVMEVIQAFVRLIGNNEDADISLKGIGKIAIRNKILDTQFNSEFVKKITNANSCSHDVNICIKTFYTFPYNSGNFWTL